MPFFDHWPKSLICQQFLKSRCEDWNQILNGAASCSQDKNLPFEYQTNEPTALNLRIMYPVHVQANLFSRYLSSFYLFYKKVEFAFLYFYVFESIKIGIYSHLNVSLTFEI